MAKENEFMVARKSVVAENQVSITRMINAPRELVFKAWTDPKQLIQWFAPNGCTIHFEHIDPRPGGTFHSCIRTPDGHDCWCKGVYYDIVEPERIVYTMAIANEKGHLIEPTEAGMDPDWPAQTIVSVHFEDVNGMTKLTLHQTVDESLAKRTGAHPSWLQMFDRLTKLVRE
jgi:uncharacterized protein YndB with AHSA1/START domain